MARAALVEIFDSVQGEGRHVGRSMTFVRVATCPIRCRYCDTPHSYTAAPTFEVRTRDAVRTEPNPCDASHAFEIVRELRGERPLVATVTGGEPLVFPDFVAELGRSLHASGGRLHLETAALDPAALGRCVEAVDHVSADYKLPGTLEDGDPRDAHVACVERAVASDATVDVKVVLVPGLDPDALPDALQRLRPYRDDVVLVLQPVTPFGAVETTVAPETVLAASRLAEDAGFDVRVIRQTHKDLGVD